jgi:chitin synthase
MYMIYGIFTAGQWTWGGPRADAAAADVHTTPRQAIEHAEATGDDLNVGPETFKPAAELRHRGRPADAPLQPSDYIEGRFAAPERGPGGWYHHSNDSGLTLPNMLFGNPKSPHISLWPHDSFDPEVTGPSSSVYLPRRVESIIGEEDNRKHLIAQQTQQEPGGAHFKSHEGKGYRDDRVEQPYYWQYPLESGSSEQSIPQDYLHPPMQQPSHQNRQNYHSMDLSRGRFQDFRPTAPSGLATEFPNRSDACVTMPEASLDPHELRAKCSS